MADAALTTLNVALATGFACHDAYRRVTRPPADGRDSGRGRASRWLAAVSRGMVPFTALYLASLLSYVSGHQRAARAGAQCSMWLIALPYFGRASFLRSQAPGSRTHGEQGCLLRHAECFRRAGDAHILSSLVCFGVPGLYSFMVSEPSLGVLQLLAAVTSSLYHYTAETLFFNADNIVALSLGATTFYAFKLALDVGDWHYAGFCIVMLPIATFLLIYCDMPGVVRHVKGRPKRVPHPRYDVWHCVWHVAAGMVTLYSTHFFHTHFPERDCGGGALDWFPNLPAVPFAGLAMSAAVNMVGNAAAVMPVS